MKRFGAAMLLSVLIAACSADLGHVRVKTTSVPLNSSDREVINQRVVQTMKDPRSVELRNLKSYIVTGPVDGAQKVLCGEYNAKNSFGAYTGFHTFYIRLKDTVPVAVSLGNSSKYASWFCNDAEQGYLDLNPSYFGN